MLKILISAYACSPEKGSEPGMGWNWCIHLAKYCEVHVITEGEFKDQIEAHIKILPQANNLFFYYIPVSDDVRKMCWNQGDWRFYYFYQQWQIKAYDLALDILRNTKIDILHQLNMIGFREPGYLWRIKQLPFIWGPIGGMFFFPVRYLESASWKFKSYFIIKNFLNYFQIRYSPRAVAAIKKASLLFASTPNEVLYIKKYHHRISYLLPETGTYFVDNKATNLSDASCFNIIWVGRFIFSKQLSIALRTISQLKKLPNIKLHIVGTGDPDQIIKYKRLCNSLELNNIVKWYGNIPNKMVFELMRQSHLFFFTSVAEATSTVILEAISCCLPIVCFDTCGFGAVVDEKIGIKVKLSSPEKSIMEFADKINYLYHNRKLLHELSENCRQRQVELSWEYKAKEMFTFYTKIKSHFSTGRN